MIASFLTSVRSCVVQLWQSVRRLQ